jgi:FKBP-type peptidyl-prolyl cis-trans isomerase FklB
MKGKQILIAVLALGILGSIAYFTSDKTLGGDASDKAGIGKTVVTDLDPAKIATIAITDNDATLTLAQIDKKWTVTERDGFAAKFDDIQKLVTSAVSLKSLRQIRASKKQHGRFELLDPADSDKNTGTRVEFKDAQGQVLKSLLLGKKGSANSGGNADSPFGSSDNQRYVLANGKVTVVAIDYSSALNDISADPANWLHKEDFLKVEKIKSITITQPNEADSWTLTRIKEGDDMALSDAKPEEKLDSSKGNSAGRVLGSPSFDDIASKSAKPEETGMDKAVTATIDTFEGYNYVVKMAKKDDEHYMSLAASGTRLAQADETAARTPQPDESNPRAQAKDEKPEDAEPLDKEHNAALAKLIADRDKAHAESQAKLREERDKTFADNFAKLAKLEGWTFKVSSYTFDAIYKTRAEMMEEKKEEESGDTASTDETSSQDGVAQKNKEAGESFLAANKDKEGVKTTDSGLQYQVTKEGTGPSPGATDSVTVNYKGTLIDGTEFDSGKGISFPLNGVIKGWTEGLQLMKTGGSTRFFIPSGLAYGTTGSGAKIGPNTTLIFNIDLLSIKGKEAAKAPTPATIDPAKTDPRKIVTSDIIKVPSAEEMKKGAKIEVIKKEDLPAEIEKAKQQTEKADDKK